MPDRIVEIEARACAATPGPWVWRGNVDTKQVYLATTHSGMVIVMDFVRWGMQGAAPAFRNSMVMEHTGDLVEYEVCPDAADRKDPRVYRGDFYRIRHPDAEFIAHAREDIDYLLARIRELEATDAAS